MNHHRILPAVLAAAFLAAPLTAATFQLITVRGTVTSQTGSWDTTVVPGTAFTATMQIDVDARDTNPASTSGIYSSPYAPSSLAVGKYLFSATGSKVEIKNGPFEDGYEFESETEFSVSGFDRIKIRIALESNNLALLANDRLPVQLFPVATFDNKKRFRFEATNGTLEGTITEYALDNATVTAPAISKRLINISTRGRVELGDDRMIAGFVVTGADTKSVIVRVLGPSLAAFGIANPLLNPRVQIFNANQVLVAENDNWQTTQAPEITATGLAPTNANESALLLSLPAGAYTAVISGVGNTSGTALVEVYEL